MNQPKHYVAGAAGPMQCERAPCLRDIAIELHSIGTSLQERGDNVDAMRFYNESLSTVITSLDQFGKGAQDSGRFSNEDIQSRMDMIEQATERLTALPCPVAPSTRQHEPSEAQITFPFTEVHNINCTMSNYIGDFQPAVTLYNMALINLEMANNCEALKLFQTAVSVLTKEGPHVPADQQFNMMILSSALNNIGHILYNCNQPEEAANVFSEAFQISKTCGNGCNRLLHSHVAPIVTNFALSINRMGEVFEQQGLHNEAMKFYQLALKKYEIIFGAGGAWTSQAFASIARNLGNLYSLGGEDVDAMKAFEISLVLQKEAVGNNTCSLITQLTLDVEILKLTTSEKAASAA